MSVPRQKKVSVTPGEALVREVIYEWIDNPPNDDDIDYDDKGKAWVKVPAKAISDLLLSQFMVSFSERRVRSALDGLVKKGHLLRASRIGIHKWSASYFYRLPETI